MGVWNIGTWECWEYNILNILNVLIYLTFTIKGVMYLKTAVFTFR